MSSWIFSRSVRNQIKKSLPEIFSCASTMVSSVLAIFQTLPYPGNLRERAGSTAHGPAADTPPIHCISPSTAACRDPLSEYYDIVFCTTHCSSASSSSERLGSCRHSAAARLPQFVFFHSKSGISPGRLGACLTALSFGGSLIRGLVGTPRGPSETYVRFHAR